MNCFQDHIDLNYEGFFVLSSYSGADFPQYVNINEFELYDPTTVDTTHEFQDSHDAKARKEDYANKMASKIGDLIHMGVEQEGEDYYDMPIEKLQEAVAT